MISDPLKGALVAVLSALALSVMGIFGKYLYEYNVDPLNIVTLRAIIAFTTLAFVYLLLTRRLPCIRIADIGLFVLLGFIGIALNYASFFLALKFTNLTTTIILLYTFPAFVVLGEFLFFGKPLNGVTITSVLLSLAGCVLITGAYDLSLLIVNAWGAVFGLTASLTKAVYTLLGKKLLGRYDAWTTTFYAMGFGAVFLLIYSSVSGVLEISLPIGAWGYIMAIAWIPTLIGYSLFVVALSYLEAGRASIIATLEPATAILLASLLLGEKIGMLQLAGIVVVLSSVLLLQLSNLHLRSRETTPTDPASSQ